MDLFSKNERKRWTFSAKMNEKDGPVQQNKRKKWTCSAKIKKDGPVQQNEIEKN